MILRYRDSLRAIAEREHMQTKDLEASKKNELTSACSGTSSLTNSKPTIERSKRDLCNPE